MFLSSDPKKVFFLVDGDVITEVDYTFIFFLNVYSIQQYLLFSFIHSFHPAPPCNGTASALRGLTPHFEKLCP